MIKKTCCSWVNLKNPLYIAYHDLEWGIPCYDDHKLFEMLILEGAQAGLSWETILNKRNNYKVAFDNFNAQKIAQYNNDKVNELLQNASIVRNRLKINAAIKNAKVFLEIQSFYGSFSNYLWTYVEHKPINNVIHNYSQAPNKTDLSDKISKDLKKKGMNFVGSTIIYAYMQAVGLVNDHEVNCYCNQNKNL